jgi:glycosyltransferase involved in cell wall biosynthesis
MDVPYFLSAMDIFCLSSVSEAFPNVVVEAMAMGLPCVATRAGDAADILGNDEFIVPVSDPHALHGALSRMYELSLVARRLLGEKGATRVRAEYEIKQIKLKYDEVYAQALRGV